MMSKRLNPERWLWLAAAAWLLAQPAPAQTNVILRLKNGDHIAGTIVAEDTNRVVVATDWIKELPVPLSAIKQREIVSAPVPPPALTNLVTVPPPAPAAKSNVVVVVKSAPPPPPPAKPISPAPPKHWKANVSVGTDLLFGAIDRQLYWSRLKFTYELPYKSNPKKFFRTHLDYNVDYGVAEGVRSANRMDGNIKTDLDFGQRLFVYNLAGAGYDEARKIDLHYEIGPGLGYHLFTEPKFVMNLEGGMNYQVQDRSTGGDVESFYLRVADDLSWKISQRVTFTQKYAFFPNVENFDQYRFRLDATLSFLLLKNLSLELTALDIYDTNPAPNVDRNEVQFRSSVGINF